MRLEDNFLRILRAELLRRKLAKRLVSDKSVDVYRGIFTGRGLDVDKSLMAGNSLKSDVNPMIEAGGWGVYVPHGIEWALEAAEAPVQHNRYREIAHLGELPALVDALGRNI